MFEDIKISDAIGFEKDKVYLLKVDVSIFSKDAAMTYLITINDAFRKHDIDVVLIGIRDGVTIEVEDAKPKTNTSEIVW